LTGCYLSGILDIRPRGPAPGLVATLGFAFVVYRLSRRINLTVFFTVVGTLLMVVAAGLVVYLVYASTAVSFFLILSRRAAREKKAGNRATPSRHGKTVPATVAPGGGAVQNVAAARFRSTRGGRRRR
jgi:hypothetical protein